GRGRGPRGFLLPPLPNHLFARDTTCWIYGGVSLNPMATRARRRETAHLEAIYRFHPLFAEADFELWFGGVDHAPGASTIEGGDVHVIGRLRAEQPSASNGTTATRCWPWPPESSSPTSATSTPTRSSARRGSRSSPSPAANWAGAGAVPAAWAVRSSEIP